MRALLFGLIVAGLGLAACGGGGDSAETTTTAVSASATTTAPTTSSTTTTTEAPATTAAATTTSAAEAATFTEISDMVYMTINGVDLLMDVYTPAGDGPWPVVVAFHGLDSHVKDSENTIPVAEAAADHGMVVFTPTWIDFSPSLFPFTVETFNTWKDTANCAVAFAQQTAADHGGDPANTVVHGFSAGVGPALFASLQPSGEPIPGCETDVAQAPVVGVVLGDGEYFLHSENFDDAFQVDPDAMQAEVAALVDPASWPAVLDADYFLWIPENDTAARPIGDASDESGWLASRDPDGSIRSDLDQLNQLEDGIISNSDAARLLELRLSTAGIEATLDEYPGGHTTTDKLPEIVGYLRAAASG